MTTGSYSFGSTAEPLYASKTWSGADDVLKKRIYNPYTMNLTRRVQSKTRMYTLAGAYLGEAYLYDCLGGMQTWSGNDELEILSRLQNKIQGHRFNLGVFAAEGKQSLDLIARSTIAVSRMFQYAVKGDYRAVGRELARIPGYTEQAREIIKNQKRLKARDVSSAWLSIQYGWRPLLNDIYEAMKAVEALTLAPRKLTYKVGFGRSVQKEDSSSPPPAGRVTCPSTQSINGWYRVHYSETISTARSLGVLDPMSVLWEKVPFSFVVDWFIPVGTYLSTVSFFSGVTMSWEKLVFAKSTTREGKLLWTDRLYVGGTLRQTRVSYTRTKGTSLSVPLPSLKAIDEALSLSHLKNAAALVFGSGARMRDSYNRSFL